MSVFRAKMILFIALSALLFAGCGKDEPATGASTPSDNAHDIKSLDKEPSGEQKTRFAVRKVLARYPDNCREVWALPDLRSVAIEYERETRESGRDGQVVAVSVDDIDIGEYNYIDKFHFSLDRRRFGYIASLPGGTDAIVVDGVQGAEYDEIQCEYPWQLFSRNGEAYAFAAKKGDKHYIVLNGCEVDEGEMLRKPVLSPDGSGVAWVAIEGDDYYVVVDGVCEKAPGEVWWLIYTADSEHYAYSVTLPDGGAVVIDGKLGKEYESFSLDELWSTPDGKVVYCAGDRDESFVVRNTLEGESYPSEGSPPKNYILRELQVDSATGIASVIINPGDGKEALAIEGRTGKPYDLIFEHPVFSKYSPQYAYVVEDNGAYLLVTKDAEIRGYDMYWSFVFSPATGELAYGAIKGEKSFIKVGKEISEERNIMRGLTFSPDGKYLAYIAACEGKEQVSIFDVTGRKDVLLAGDELYDEFYHSYLDYDAPTVPYEKEFFIWDSPTTFHYLARDGDRIYLVEEEIIEE